MKAKSFIAILLLLLIALHVYTQNTKQPVCSDYHELRNGINNSYVKFKTEKKGTVAFLGGSITYNPGWRDSICNYLEYKFPETKFTFITAGIPSFGSTENAFRLDRDVLSKGKVDLLFVESAVNDEGKNRSEKEIERSMEGIVRHALKTNPAMDFVFMYFVDPRKIEAYNSGNTPVIIKIHEKIAKYYNIPIINLAKEVTDRINAGEFTWKDDFKDLHPSPFGQGIYARSMITFLDSAFAKASKSKIQYKNRKIPPELDKHCYDNGILIPSSEIKPAKGWKYIKNWEPPMKARTRANYTQVPMLVGEYPAKPVKFEFSGTAVGVAVAAGPDAGIIKYRIDDGKWKTKDLFTRFSEIYYLPWYYILNDELSPGKHTVEIKLSSKTNRKSKGKTCVLRYLFVNKN